MSRFMKGALSGLAPYTPGEQPQGVKLIKLNTNENPYPPGPQVAAVLGGTPWEREGCVDKGREQGRRNRAVAVREQRLYPDPTAGEGTAAVAKYYGLEEDQVLLGNGSDEILAFAFMAYGEAVRFPETSYGFYPVFAEIFQSNREAIPLGEHLEIRPADYYEAGRTVILANPNAPTGMALSLPEIEGILQHNRENLVIIDEAYVDFGGESCVKIIDTYDNLLVVQTFSKSRSLAGLRIGMALAQKEIIADLNKIKYSFNPYNLSRDAIAAVKASMEEEAYFRETVDKIIATREWFTGEMKALGFEVLPSATNFLFVKSGRGYYEALRGKGILVRYFDKEPIREYVRITIGTEEEMRALLRATVEWCEEKAEKNEKGRIV